MSSRRKQSKPKSFATELDVNGQPQPVPIEAQTTATTVAEPTQIEHEPTNPQNNIVTASTPLSLKRKRTDLDETELSFSHINEVSKTDDQTVTHNTGDETELDVDLNEPNGDDTDELLGDYASLTQYDENELEESNYNEDDDNLGPLPNNKRSNITSDDIMDANGSLLMFKCKVCGKAFKHRRSLNRHVKLHSGEKNFKCPYCTTAFARSDHLKAHIRTHNNSKPYRCPICQCGYSTQAALKVHMAHHHSKSKFKCVLCDNLEFHSQLALEGHIYTKHSKENNDINDLINETSGRSTQSYASSSNAHNGSFFNGDHYNLNDESQLSNTPNANRSRLADINNIKDNNSVLDVNESPKNNSLKQSEQQQQSFNGANNENNGNQAWSDGNQENYSNEDEPINEDNDQDVIIEDSSPSKQQQQQPQMNGLPKLAPKQMPTKNVYLNGAMTQSQPIVNSAYAMSRNMPPQQQLQQTPNTYCELCNARFSNVESYAAHMRNCHPTIPYQQHKPTNYNMLSNALASQKPMPPKPPAITKISGGIVIPLANNNNTKPNFSNGNHYPLLNDSLNSAPTHTDMYILKETHYTCSQCTLTFVKLNDYMLHLKQEHSVEVYKCILCKQMTLFENLNELREHFFQVHQSHKYDLYKCKMCLSSANHTHQLVYNNIDDLYAHIQNVHQQNLRGPAPRQFNSGSTMLPPPAPLYNKLFKCTFCDSEFSQQNSLNQHVQMVHKNESSPSQQFACQYCRNTFTNRAQLERHLRIHVSSIDLKCNICDKMFETQDSLAQHKLTHCKTFEPELAPKNAAPNASPSTTGAVVCVYCKQNIENELQFKEHFKRHNNIGQNGAANNQTQGKASSYICVVCRQTLTSNNEYNLHMRHHLRRSQLKPAPTQTNGDVEEINKEEKPKCQKCLVKFEVWQELVDHMAKVHNINQPSRATQSPTPSIRSTTSNSSNSIPNGDAQNGDGVKKEPNQSQVDFLCEICSSKFDCNAKLQAHLLIKHEFSNSATNSVNAMTCPVCDETFARANFLLQHTVVHGQAAKIYKCTQCPQAFVFKSQLLNHSFSHLNPSDKASQAANRAYTLRSSNSPVKGGSEQNGSNSPYQQQMMAKRPQTNMNGHQQQQQPRPMPYMNNYANNQLNEINGNIKTYTCDTCFKTFASQRNLNVHVRIHTGFRPFECDVCKRKFTRRENLRSHMKCHLNLRPFPCPICSRLFRRKSHVVSHIEVHIKSKIHNCIECTLAFDTLENYLKHILNNHSNHSNGFNKNLINLIQQKSLLESSELNELASMLKEMAANAGPEVNDNGDANSNDSLTIQSMIDQNGYYDDANGEDQDGEEDDGEFDDESYNQTVDNSAYDQIESDNPNQNNDLMNEQELENELQDQLNEYGHNQNESQANDDDEIMFGNDANTNEIANNNHIDFNDNDDEYILNDNDDDVDNLS